MTTTISPTLGAGALLTQQGVGTTPGYAALDVRRAAFAGLRQGHSGTGAYTVSQRGAGANMSVDVAASAGTLLVFGTTITNQGGYLVPAHSATVNEAIAGADPTNPRVDQVVVRVYDNVIDSTGNNRAEITVLTGTPTGGATLANRSGAAALPASTYRLADVLVGAGVTSITNAAIQDRRPRTRGKSIVAAAEARTNAAYGFLSTPDVVRDITLPTDGLIFIAYQALWKSANSNAASASLFLNSTQARQQVGLASGAAPAPIGQAAAGVLTPDAYRPLFTHSSGIVGSNASAGGDSTSDVTTGQILGLTDLGGGNAIAARNESTGALVTISGAAGNTMVGGPLAIFAAAGSYDVGVQFKATSGAVTAKERKLWVWTLDFDNGVMA